MNAKSPFAAAAITFIGTAADAQDVQNYPTPSTLTRAQVQAELASHAGRPSSQVEVFGSVVPGTATTLSRQEVRAEAVAAMRHRSVGQSGD